MKNNFFSLVPERVQFDQFWVEIRHRNRWMILLRYGAVIMLASLILGIIFLQDVFPGFFVNTYPLWIIASLILIYNLGLHRLWHYIPKIKENYSGFHSLHFSLLQIILDLIALIAFMYFTGGVETPFFAFFIFHVIIGSLFLSGSVIAIIVTMILISTITGAILELYGIIPHYGIQGLLHTPLYNNASYLIIFFVVFGITLYLSIYLANSIAKQLYIRERSLTKAYNELENAEKTKSRYVMSVVHDLKTPIAAVMTYLNMLLDGTLGEIKEEQKRPLDRSKYRLTNAISTINSILQISQLKLESSPENISEINVVELIEEIYADLRVLIISKDIEYSFLCDSKENAVVQAEPKLLKLALSNLTSNSYKYTEQYGKIEIIVNDLKDSVLISFADSGIGIPEADKEKIFNEFYRTSLSKRKGIEGTGLGMSIVLNIIQRFHGEISVESPSYLNGGEARPGTQFIIRLPKTYRLLD